MAGVELRTSARDGHVVVALCGELDVTGAADAEAAITALATRGRRYAERRLAVSAASPGRAAPSRTGTG